MLCSDHSRTHTGVGVGVGADCCSARCLSIPGSRTADSSDTAFMRAPKRQQLLVSAELILMEEGFSASKCFTCSSPTEIKTQNPNQLACQRLCKEKTTTMRPRTSGRAVHAATFISLAYTGAITLLAHHFPKYYTIYSKNFLKTGIIKSAAAETNS